MSAFIVSDEHIRYLLAASLRYAEHGDPLYSPEELETTGIMLMNANIQSVNYRYSENTPLVTTFDTDDVHWVKIEAAQAFKAINCLEYQCCEPPSWHGSPAEEWLRLLERRIIRSLPEYEEADWEIPAAVAKAKGE